MSISRELVCGRSVSPYEDDVTVIVSSVRHFDLVGERVSDYEPVIGLKIKSERSMGL